MNLSSKNIPLFPQSLQFTIDFFLQCKFIGLSLNSHMEKRNCKFMNC